MNPKTEANPKGAGRRKMVINWELAKSLAEIQCTEFEIAHILKISVVTLQNRCKTDNKCDIGEFIAENAMGGHTSLRRWQFQSAKEGNVTMQIWLGKQYLKQSDRQEIEHHGIGRDASELTDAELASIITTRRSRRATQETASAPASD